VNIQIPVQISVVQHFWAFLLHADCFALLFRHTLGAYIARAVIYTNVSGSKIVHAWSVLKHLEHNGHGPMRTCVLAHVYIGS
jgi:hypothetical protein